MKKTLFKDIGESITYIPINTKNPPLFPIDFLNFIMIYILRINSKVDITIWMK